MTEGDAAVWSQVLEHIRSHHASISRQWFEDLEPLGAHEGIYRDRVGSDIRRNYLERSCTDPFTDAVQAVTGHLLALEFLGPTDVPPAPEAEHRLDASENGPITPDLRADSRVEAADDAPPASPTSADLPPAPAGRIGPVRHDADPGIDREAEAPLEPHIAPEPKLPIPGPTQQGVPQPGGKAPFRASVRGQNERRAPGGYADELVINPDYTFDHFVVGPENHLAYAAAKAVGDAPGEAYNPLVIHGGVGLGKSHLLQAICLRLLEHTPDITIHYVSCEAFSTAFFEAVQRGEMSEFRHRFRDVDVLVIDDIHFLTKRDRTQEEFFHTFNALYQHRKQIVLSSDAPPNEIPDLEARLVSRFQSGLVVEVMRPGYETRVQIVKQKSRLHGIQMPDDVASYIAAKIDANIREIEGAITRVNMQSMAEGKPLTEDLARVALGEEAVYVKPEVRLQTIIDAVIEHYGVKLTDIMSKRKPKSIALPRQVCMYLAREHTRHSLQEIGAQIGGRDHTTVMHAHKVIGAKRKPAREFDHVLSTIESRFSCPPPPNPAISSAQLGVLCTARWGC